MSYPRKPAPTDLPILEAISERSSPLAFSNTQIEEEKMAILFEAARWAPSSHNEQPWRYIFTTNDDGEARMAMESLLLPGNAWAKQAYLLIIGFASRISSVTGKENRFAIYDAGCATGYMSLQLPSLGLIGHQMGGFRAENANDVLGVPPEFSPLSMMAIGYPAEASSLTPEQRKRQESPRVRNALPSFVFRGKWPDGSEN